MSTPPRIDGILAADAPVAVVFRRGPSKLTQQLVWNTESDEVTAGQWIGGRVYTRRCDVSPDGRYLVGSYTNYGSRREHQNHLLKHPWSSCGWTAISRPPYYTAIALWFTGGAWNGGGIWDGPREVHLNKFPHHWEVAIKPDKKLKVRTLNWGASEDEPIYSMLLTKRGWVRERETKVETLNPNWRKAAGKFCDFLKDLAKMDASTMDEFASLMEASTPKYKMTQAGRWTKAFSRGQLERIDHWDKEEWSVRDESGVLRLNFKMPQFGCQFLDVDHRGRVIYGDQGQLWAWEDFPSGRPQMVCDLRQNTFQPVPPPDWAKEW